jgi:hypothetical protein
MSTKLAMVTTTEPAAQQPALSPTRAAVARARGLRKDADAALSEAVKAQKAAEQLVGARDKIKARIVELERKAAGAVEAWATTGGAGKRKDQVDSAAQAFHWLTGATPGEYSLDVWKAAFGCSNSHFENLSWRL